MGAEERGGHRGGRGGKGARRSAAGRRGGRVVANSSLTRVGCGLCLAASTDGRLVLREARQHPGEVAEWSNVRDWKSRVVERLPRVRIPPSPPFSSTRSDAEGDLATSDARRASPMARGASGDGGQFRKRSYTARRRSNVRTALDAQSGANSGELSHPLFVAGRRRFAASRPRSVAIHPSPSNPFPPKLFVSVSTSEACFLAPCPFPLRTAVFGCSHFD